MADEVGAFLGDVLVHATSGRGQTPEEIAERAVNRIIHVGSNVHPAIRDQAEAFRAAIRDTLVFYIKDAIRAHNVTLANRFRKAGHPELIPILDD